MNFLDVPLSPNPSVDREIDTPNDSTPALSAAPSEKSRPSIISASELNYLEKGNCKKVLFLMCVGLRDEGSYIFDLNSTPFTFLKKNEIKPSKLEYAAEVSRRSQILPVNKTPRPSGWALSKLTEWLESNPIIDHADIEFLKSEVLKLSKLLYESKKEADDQQQATSGAWRGNVPYLCLILCLAEDDIKAAYLHHAWHIAKYPSAKQTKSTLNMDPKL